MIGWGGGYSKGIFLLRIQIKKSLVLFFSEEGGGGGLQ